MDDHPGLAVALRRHARSRGARDVQLRVRGAADRRAATSGPPFIDGSFVAAGGVRKGMGHFHMGTDALRAAEFPFDINAKGEMLKDLDGHVLDRGVSGQRHHDAALCIPMRRPTDFVTTTIIDYHHEAEESGAGLMTFSGTDSASGATISVVSQWMASGRGRADATATDGTVSGTRTQCWDDSFVETYDYTWPGPRLRRIPSIRRS